MSDCCSDKQCALESLRERQSGTLRIVLAINALMFVIELASGLLARSTALLSDSLDNFGDAATYAASLYAVSRSEHAKARVALLKGSLIRDLQPDETFDGKAVQVRRTHVRVAVAAQGVPAQRRVGLVVERVRRLDQT